MIKKLIYVVVFLLSTIGFVVLFENGPDNYVANFQKKVDEITALVTGGPIKKQESKPAVK